MSVQSVGTLLAEHQQKLLSLQTAIALTMTNKDSEALEKSLQSVTEDLREGVVFIINQHLDKIFSIGITNNCFEVISEFLERNQLVKHAITGIADSIERLCFFSDLDSCKKSLQQLLSFVERNKLTEEDAIRRALFMILVFAMRDQDVFEKFLNFFEQHPESLAQNQLNFSIRHAFNTLKTLKKLLSFAEKHNRVKEVEIRDFDLESLSFTEAGKLKAECLKAFVKKHNLPIQSSGPLWGDEKKV